MSGVMGGGGYCLFNSPMDAGTKVDMARLDLRGRKRDLLPEGNRLLKLCGVQYDESTFPDGLFVKYGCQSGLGLSNDVPTFVHLTQGT